MPEHSQGPARARAGPSAQASAWAFVGWLLALSLPFWALGVLAPVELLPYGLPISALMTFVPAAAAVLLTAGSGGLAATRTLLGRTVDGGRFPRGGPLLLAVSIMPLVSLSSWLLLRSTGQPLPSSRVAWEALPVMALVYLVGAVGEELGWTGYLTDRLLPRLGELRAALVIGVVWQAWHVVPFLAMGRPLAWIAAQLAAGVLMRILIVRLYVRGGRSVLLAVVFHTTVNVTFSLFPDRGSHYDPVTTAVLLGVVVLLTSRLGHGRVRRAAPVRTFDPGEVRRG